MPSRVGLMGQRCSKVGGLGCHSAANEFCQWAFWHAHLQSSLFLLILSATTLHDVAVFSFNGWSDGRGDCSGPLDLAPHALHNLLCIKVINLDLGGESPHGLQARLRVSDACCEDLESFAVFFRRSFLWRIAQGAKHECETKELSS